MFTIRDPHLVAAVRRVQQARGHATLADTARQLLTEVLTEKGAFKDETIGPVTKAPPLSTRSDS